MAMYSKIEYWNDRYTQSRNMPPYDWYQNYNTLKHLLNPETLSGCSPAPAYHHVGSRNSNNNSNNNNYNNFNYNYNNGINPSNTNTTMGSSNHSTSSHAADDDASVSTTTMTNSTRAKAYQCLHPNNCRILILGCGNSTLGASMYEAGWRGGGGSGNMSGDNDSDNTHPGRFVQVDFSPVVIDQMKERYNEDYYQTLFNSHAAVAAGMAGDPSTANRMEFLCLDITQTPLPFENGSFDLIICKGVFDAILCSAGSVYNIRRLVKECVRLLNDDGGVLMVCTYGNPDNRVVFLEDEDGEVDTYWQKLSIHPVPSMIRARKSGGGNHSSSNNKNDYVYLCRKRRGAWKESMAVAAPSRVASHAGSSRPGDNKDGVVGGQETENEPKKAASVSASNNHKETEEASK